MAHRTIVQSRDVRFIAVSTDVFDAARDVQRRGDPREKLLQNAEWASAVTKLVRSAVFVCSMHTSAVC